LTDAERQSGDESARFAGHIVKQAQFNALATGRFWKQTRGGPWDGGHETDAHRTLAHHGITVLYATSPIEELGTTPYGMHEHLSTGTVRFYRQGPLQLTNLDPLVFSEIMRDVDLFVAVSSVSNDPDWQHRQHHTYWQDNSFGDLNQTAQTRRVVLESMVPKLKIAKQLSLSDRFLTVAGTLRTYHIHLGSGNILMDPNDQYLCIVSGAVRSKAVYLPFEGDARLTLILSKAFLLADDHKIKDATIMSQIQHAAAA
ncbi:MAG: DUF4132 domain-containing protein, partial [Gammaproteobacteria bacterium]|nr:DUF4132 domain-containing protein [Gammaproteobacteria bacterium]